MTRRTLAVLLALAGAGPAAAQEVRTAIAPDTITAGGVFRVAIRVIVPRGALVTFPDSLAVPEDVEAAGSRVLARDSVDAAREAFTATYALTAWRPGSFRLDPASIGFRNGDRTSEVEAVLPPVAVLSVLPADTAGIEPQPPRGVLGPDRALLPLLLLAALIVAVATAAVFAARRLRRRRPPEVLATVPPRERALAELDRIRRSGLLEAGQYKAFCTAVSSVVRTYLADLDPSWSTDLTTTELAGAMRTEAVPLPARISDAARVGADGLEEEPDPAAYVVRLLGAADVLKFTGTPGSESRASTIWTRARTWVESPDAGARTAA